MLFASLIAKLKLSLAKRAKYQQLVKEIQSLTDRDLSDMRADRTDMLFEAYRQVYGGGRTA
jgi:hypothetical protein